MQEAVTTEFEEKRRQREAEAEAKTAKNRAKRQKKKERAKTVKEGAAPNGKGDHEGSTTDAPLKKRRLVNGQELVFRRPGEDDSDEDESNQDEIGPVPGPSDAQHQDTSHPVVDVNAVPVVEGHRIIIHEED